MSGILQLRYESSDNAVMITGYIRIVSSFATKRNASLFPFVDAFFFLTYFIVKQELHLFDVFYLFYCHIEKLDQRLSRQ